MLAAVVPKEFKWKWSFGFAGARGFGMLGGHVRRIKSSKGHIVFEC